MIINITQHCTLRCPHCMQCAGPERTEFMDKETFLKSIEFAKNIKSDVLTISGGEPTSHPLFFEFLKIALASNFASVNVLSNGTFLQDHDFTEQFANIVKYYSEFFLQISSFKTLYANYDQIHKPNLRGLRLFQNKVVVCDESNSQMRIKPLGRASSGEWFEQAKQFNGFPSCANSCLILAQNTHNRHRGVGGIMKMYLRFCLPIVSWDGNIRLGESEQCKVVANISEPLQDINDKLFAFRPCGNCQSFKWHFEPPKSDKDKQVAKVLWPNS